MFGKPSATIIFPNELDSMQPIEISDPATGLEAAFVKRYAIESLSTPWQRGDLGGIFVLLDDIRFTSGFKVYVGGTTTGFEQVLQERNEHSAFWSTALLFANHDGDNLSAAQVDLLVEETLQLLAAGQHVQVQNEPIAMEADLPVIGSQDQDFIEEMALFVVRVMFLQGYRSHSLAQAVHAIESHAAVLHPAWE